MKTVTINIRVFSESHFVDFLVPDNEAPMYDNVGWIYVIEEYLDFDYTISEIKDIIKKDSDRMRVDNLELLINE